jgi:hypothetical protein
MASALGAASTVGLMAAATGNKPSSISSAPSISTASRVRLQRRSNFRVKAAKELYFNKDGSATKKLQVSLPFSPFLCAGEPWSKTDHSSYIFSDWSQQACGPCWSYTGTKGEERCFGEQVWVS